VARRRIAEVDDAGQGVSGIGLRRSSQHCPFGCLRKAQGDEIFLWKQIVLAHLIDDADQAMLQTRFVWNQAINLAHLQRGSVALVRDAHGKLCFVFHLTQ
jgi:hypothetical protein